MGVPILKSKSYLLMVGFPSEILQSVEEFALKNDFKMSHCASVNECLETLSKIKHNLGVFINTGALLKTDFDMLLAEIESKHLSHKFFVDKTSYKVPQEDTAPLDVLRDKGKQADFLTRYLFSIVPQELKDLSLSSFKLLLGTFLTDLKFNLQETISLNGDYNYLISCSTNSPEFSGYIIIRGDLKKITPLVSSHIKDSNLLDAFREICNQTLGLINRSFNKQGIDTRIGLPTVMIINESKDGFIKVKSTYYYPFFLFEDKDRALAVEFGFKEDKPGVLSCAKNTVDGSDGGMLSFFDD